jgi:hypothetical protein
VQGREGHRRVISEELCVASDPQAGYAYSDVKAENVLCFWHGGRRSLAFGDVGALVRLGDPGARRNACSQAVYLIEQRLSPHTGTATYPPPDHATGLDVPVTERVMLWGLAALMLAVALEDHFSSLCYCQKVYCQKVSGKTRSADNGPPLAAPPGRRRASRASQARKGF